jgi:galactokinase
VRENARVPRALTAFQAADAATLGELACASQEEADWLLGNQVPHTRELVRAALATGARAASSFGAGFGGSAWALVDAGPDEAARFLTAWRDAYRNACPGMTGVDGFVTGAEAGLSRR